MNLMCHSSLHLIFHPDDLYKDGLQRETFVPAILLLKTILEIIRIPDGPDHRRSSLLSRLTPCFNEKTYYKKISSSR